MSRHHRSPRPWRRWCSCCCRPPAGRRSALHPVPTDWTSCDVKKRNETKQNKKKSNGNIQRIWKADDYQIVSHLLLLMPVCCQLFMSGDWYPGGGACWSRGVWEVELWGDNSGLVGLMSGGNGGSCWTTATTTWNKTPGPDIEVCLSHESLLGTTHAHSEEVFLLLAFITRDILSFFFFLSPRTPD